MLFRLWCLAGAAYALWWAYRLLAAPFEACRLPGVKIPGRWVAEICAAHGHGWAAALMALGGVLLLGAAVWRGRRRPPAADDRPA